MRKVIVLLSILIALVLLDACKHEVPEIPESQTGTNPPTEDCDPGTVYFQQQILPLFQSSCGVPGCHDSDPDDEAEFTLRSYNDLLFNPQEDELIIPGNANDGDIMDVITDGEMPPDGYDDLTSDQIQLIRTWINQGALDNSCQNLNCDTNNVTFSQTILPLIENKCQGCHSGSNPQGGIALNNYSEIAFLANTGFLEGVTQWTPGYEPMPFSGNQIPQCNQDQIRIWVEAGAPNN